MIEIYNKYGKLEISFNKIDDVQEAIRKCNELKYKGHKIIRKYFPKLLTYYCTTCKTRTYFSDHDSDGCCKTCNDSENLYFVGFKQTDKPIEEVFYAN